MAGNGDREDSLTGLEGRPGACSLVAEGMLWATGPAWSMLSAASSRSPPGAGHTAGFPKDWLT